MIERKVLDGSDKVAVLVALNTPTQSREKTQEYLDELAFLAFTLGIKTIRTFTQQLEAPHRKTFVGKGKLEEIAAFVQEHCAMVIFDEDLTPSQVRNLEGKLQCKILDRSLLILEIFAMRAKTAQAKIQVELAQYQYLLPRLTRMWTHLSRQKGGSAGMRGPGEKELETDRRIVQNKVAHLRAKLAAIEKQRMVQRKGRDQLVRVALVGYTNVGKSTLMRLLSGEDVYVEDRLFATLDSTIRKVSIDNIPFLISDTVGFIRKLPHTLIECFKSTLAEVQEADILLHVVDVAHPAHEEHMRVVEDTLRDIGVVDTPVILVYNKADQLSGEGEDGISAKEHWANKELDASREGQRMVLVSAQKRSNIERLSALLKGEVYKKYKTIYPNYLRSLAE